MALTGKLGGGGKDGGVGSGGVEGGGLGGRGESGGLGGEIGGLGGLGGGAEAKRHHTSSWVPPLPASSVVDHVVAVKDARGTKIVALWWHTSVATADSLKLFAPRLAGIPQFGVGFPTGFQLVARKHRDAKVRRIRQDAAIHLHVIAVDCARVQRRRRGWRKRRGSRRRQPGLIRLCWRRRRRRWWKCRYALPQLPRPRPDARECGVAVVDVWLGVLNQAALRVFKIQAAVRPPSDCHVVAIRCVTVAIACASVWKIRVHVEPRTGSLCACTDVYVLSVWVVDRVCNGLSMMLSATCC
eukprot:387360-Prymnesium_polylepis.1